MRRPKVRILLGAPKKYTRHQAGIFFAKRVPSGLRIKKWKACLTLSWPDVIIKWKVNFTFKRSEGVKNKLEEIRKQRGIKQEELAAALEVSRQTIGSLENGRYNPSILLAFRIARFFSMSIEEIFIYEEDESNEEENL